MACEEEIYILLETLTCSTEHWLLKMSTLSIQLNGKNYKRSCYGKEHTENNITCTSATLPMLGTSHTQLCTIGYINSTVQEIWSHKITNAYRTMKHGLLQGLTVQIVMGMSLCLNTSLWTSIFAVSNGTSFLSVDGRVQKIQSRTKIIEMVYFMGSQLHISDGDVTILLHTLINFNLCCIQWFKSHVHRW